MYRCKDHQDRSRTNPSSGDPSSKKLRQRCDNNLTIQCNHCNLKHNQYARGYVHANLIIHKKFCIHRAERFRSVQPGCQVIQDARETHVVLWSRFGQRGEIDVYPTMEPDARVFPHKGRVEPR